MAKATQLDFKRLYNMCILSRNQLWFILGMIFISYIIHMMYPNHGADKEEDKKYRMVKLIVLYPLWIYFALFMFNKPAYVLAMFYVGLSAYDVYQLQLL